jgi:hypothetical protein
MIKNYIILVLLALLFVVLGTKYAKAPQAEGAVIKEIPEIMLRIAECESNNTAHAKNPNSSASGRFQFINSSWEYYGKMHWGGDWINKNVFDWDDNTELALYVYERNGTRDWLASSHCWLDK